MEQFIEEYIKISENTENVFTSIQSEFNFYLVKIRHFKF